MAFSPISTATERTTWVAAVRFNSLIGFGSMAGASKAGSMPIAGVSKRQASTVISEAAHELNK